MIPPKLQSYVLGELHVSRPGIVKMKTLARKYIWRPNIDRELEKLFKTVMHVKLTDKSQEVPLYILGVDLLEHGSELILVLLDPSWDTCYSL